MKFFSSSENQLLNIYQHTTDMFVTQNWNNFVQEKKFLHQQSKSQTNWKEI